jgi:hypothetical protein
MSDAFGVLGWLQLIVGAKQYYQLREEEQLSVWGQQ